MTGETSLAHSTAGSAPSTDCVDTQDVSGVHSTPREAATDEDLALWEGQLLDALSVAGKAVGNSVLRANLGWPEDRYGIVRGRLMERGLIEKWRGRGGSVRRVVSEAPSEPVVGAPPPSPWAPPLDPAFTPPAAVGEAVLYAPIESVLRSEWATTAGYDQFVVEITAKQGKKDTGGRWTRPDLVFASMRTYQYVYGKYFDVITFEVKPSTAIDVTAVYEALAHRRAATRAYVALHIPVANAESDANLDRVCAEAERHGIGVIVFEDPGDFETWDERVEPRRHEPDPDDLNKFIGTQMSAGARDRIMRWFR